MLIGILLILLGFFFIIAEVMIPSGGIISILAVASMIVGFIFGFQEGILQGFILIVGTIILLPIVLTFAFKFFPKTSIGKKMIADGVSYSEQERKAIAFDEKALVGQVGKAKTVLRPAGIVEINGEEYDVVSEGDIIEAGKSVQVIEVAGNRIVVRELT